MKLETYGMIIYGGVTTVLFLIISVLAYKRLNNEHTGALPIPKSTTGTHSKMKGTKHGTLFPFYSGITPTMTMQQIQQIGAQSRPNPNPNPNPNPRTDESVTETSIMFNTNFWSSKYPNKVIPSILNEMNHDDDDDDNDAVLMYHSDDDDEVVFNIIGSRYSLSNTHSHLNITPQMIHPKLSNDKSSHSYHKTLSNPACIKHIHLQRQRSRHSLSHLAVAKRTCSRVTIEYFKEMLRNRSIYSPSLQHTWDVATDISVLLKWGKHAFQGTDIAHIDFVPLFWTSLLVQVGYRLVSGYAVYKSERSVKKAALQICDLLMLREIYVSHIECRITDTLVYIKKLEAVLEAAPQLILTTYFFLRVGTLESSYTEIIGWLWSFFTLSTKVINDDTKMYKHIKSRWNRQFMYRCLFRLFEICSRVMVIGLVATAVSARAAMVVIVLDLFFLLFSYYYGLLSNDKMNILGSLITFVDLTIYPKVSPLYSWYVSISHNQKRVSRHHKYKDINCKIPNKNIPSQSWTGSALHKLLTSTPFNHNHNHTDTHQNDNDNDKSRSKFGKIFNFNIFHKNNANDHSGSTSTTARSNLCSLENSIEMKRNENTQEEKENLNMNELPPSKLNLSITVPRNDNATMYVRPVHEGQLSVREKSSYLLKQMTSIEAVYLELQQEETLHRRYTKYRCCGCCCCWFKCCGGCLPQFMVQTCVHKWYLVVLCTSWLWCIYCLTFLCIACNNCSAEKKRRNRVQKNEASLLCLPDEDTEDEAPITQQLALAIQGGGVSVEREEELEPSAPAPIPDPQQRVSFSDRFKHLKIKKVRFADAKLKDRTKPNCKHKAKEDPSMSDPIPHQLSHSNTITDSQSVMKMVDFAQKKSFEVADETSSDEAPQDWWNSEQGSTKFAVATLRSLHSIDGGFPDLPDGLTPVSEYKADKVYPVNSLKDLAIQEGSEEASFPWQSPTAVDVLNANTNANATQTAHMHSITPFSNPLHNLKVNINRIEYVTDPDTQASDDSISTQRTNSDDVAMRIMMEILEYAGIGVSLESSTHTDDTNDNGTFRTKHSISDSDQDSFVSQTLEPENSAPLSINHYLGNLPTESIIHKTTEDEDDDELSISMDTDSVGSSTPNQRNSEELSMRLCTDSVGSSHEENQEEINRKPLNLDEYLGNLPRDTIIPSDDDDELCISMDTDSVHLSDTPTASKGNDETSDEPEEKGMAALLGITESDRPRMTLPTEYHPVRNISIQKSFDTEASSESQKNTIHLATLGSTERYHNAKASYVSARNMAIEKSFEMFDSEEKTQKKSISSMTYAISADSVQSSNRSGNSTPFVAMPNDAHRQALLALAGLENNEADRLKRLFTNPSALNSECSTAATTPVFAGFPDIGDGMPLSRGVSLRDKSMTIPEQPQLEEEKYDHLSIAMPPVTTISPSMSALTLERSASPSTEIHIEIVVDDNDTNTKGDLGLVPIQIDVEHLTPRDIFATPHFTVNTPQAIYKKDIKPFCGIQRFIFDRGIVHRYAFLVVLARTLQSLCLVPFIAYIVYINPSVFGGKADIEESNEYWIGCYPWCTSQSLRYELRNSLVFMQFVIACSVTAILAILCFLLSSPYLLFATSISRSPLSLLKTGCIYDSMQYFSKKAKCTPLQILCDFNFMQMFFDEIIKRRIPVFYGEEKDINIRQHKILKNADSEILLTALQLNISAQLAETVAIHTIKEGYLHLLVFIMCCASMEKENRLMFDPSNCVDEDGNGLLHVAIIRGDERIIQYVLDVLGYDPRKNMSNQDTIDLLILHGDIHILRLMLSFFKTANRLDLTKKTFYKSIKRGNMEFVTVLMEVLQLNDAALWITNYIDRDKSESACASFLTGRTLLMCTAMHGHANTTQWLLNTMKVDAAKQDKEGKTALMHAAIHQNVNVIDIFIKHPHINSYINAACNKAITALLYATIEGSLDCVCTLMQKRKLDPNIRGGIHEETALIHAARYGHQEIALQLIKAKHIKVNIQNNGGKTALMFAARYGLTKIVKELLSHDDIDVFVTDDDHKTALDHVEENIYLGDHYAVVKKTIQAYIRSKSQAQQVDPKRLAQKRRSFIMIGELAAQQISNKVKRRYSKSHRSGSRKASHNHSKESTPRSVRNRSKRRNKSRSKSMVGLKLDVAEGPPPLVDLSIDDVEFYLWYSIQMDYGNVCHWFLQNTRCGRDLVGRQDLEMIDIGLVGRNPFHFAVKTGSNKCLRILLEIDGFEKETFVNEKDKEGFTPLIYAVIDGKMTIVESLLNYHDTEVNGRDDNHVTPLMHASMRGHANIVQLLLYHNNINDIDPHFINYVDKKGQTALCLAVRYNRPRVVQLLLDHNDIEVDKARNNGRTPLMYAVKNGLIDIVNMLLFTNNVDINKKDYIQGHTVEFYVKQCKNDSIAKQIDSRLTFYKLTKRRQHSYKNGCGCGHDLQLRMLNDFIVSDASVSHRHLSEVEPEPEPEPVPVSTAEADDSRFYRLATQQVETKRVQNDWNIDSMDIEIEDRLFNKWRMQLQILHVCAERQDDTVFKELWKHWIGPESIVTAIKLDSLHRSQSSSAMNLYDMLSQEWLMNRETELLSEKDHFQCLKWYYFMVMISHKGWHRLFIRFIQEIEHKQIKINWKFIPNDPREIDLMAKHGDMDELEQYLKRMRSRNVNDSNSNLKDVMNTNQELCCYFSHYTPQKHMQLMLESIFENFGQSAATKPKLGQCLRFVLAKTMSQYLFNSKLCY